MNYLISGANGRMGRSLSKKRGVDTPVCGVSRTVFETDFPVYTSFDEVVEDFDVIIDFSSSANVRNVLNFAKKVKKPLIVGTTALTDDDEKYLSELSKEIPILYTHNTAFGVNILLNILEYAASMLKSYDIELIEKHDRCKLDAPSGTSSMVIDAIESGLNKELKRVHGRVGKAPREENEIGIHSIRAGNLGSEHYVSFIGEDETIEISHYAANYDIYAQGAIKAGNILMQLPPGLYSMKEIIKNDC